MATATPLPTRQAGAKPVKRMSMSDMRTTGRNLPTRLVMHGLEGCGKTSYAAFAPKPVFIMTAGETGLETLIDSGQLPEIPHFPEVQTWLDLLGILDAILEDEHDRQTLVIDTGNGAERLCHEEVCRRDYNGDWGKQGFTSYMQGYDVALADWRLFLAKLDRIREQRRMAIIVLCHTKITTFKNPTGADYDRYEPKMHAKTWGLTKEWADIILFADYETEIIRGRRDNETAKGKAVGGSYRTMRTVRTATFDAKNRHGLPEEIEMGVSGKEAWNNFVNAMKKKGG